MVNVLTRALQGQPELVVKMLDYILSIQFAAESSQKDYSDAVRSFQGARLGEIQRIAMVFPDYLLVRDHNTLFRWQIVDYDQDVYGDLEARVTALLRAQPDDERLRWGLQSFLFIIV